MMLYPLLESLSKVESKPALEGLLQGHLKAATDEGAQELAGKLKTAVGLLSEASSIEDFLATAKSRRL